MAVKRMLEVDSSRNQALKLMRFWSVGKNLDSPFLERMEVWLREQVREEVDRTFQKLLPQDFTPPINLIKGDVACPYELHFNCTLPEIFFTFNAIEAENGRVEIVIRDAISKETIKEGHLSSKKVEIVVLHSDFDGQENWTKDMFDKSVVTPRKDKGPLLKGQLEIKLSKGVGYLDKISFTDNSSWTRRNEFRLGAIIKESSSSGQRIREAKSEAFSVKDQRGEANRKDRPPSLNEEVWRLKHIGKRNSERLTNEGIKTVNDFLNADRKRLLRILGPRMRKKLKATFEHAEMHLVGRTIYQGNGDTAVETFPNVGTTLSQMEGLEMNNSAEHPAYPVEETLICPDDKSLAPEADAGQLFLQDDYICIETCFKDYSYTGIPFGC